MTKRDLRAKTLGNGNEFVRLIPILCLALGALTFALVALNYRHLWAAAAGAAIVGFASFEMLRETPERPTKFDVYTRGVFERAARLLFVLGAMAFAYGITHIPKGSSATSDIFFWMYAGAGFLVGGAVLFSQTLEGPARE
jgi:hypothetical protein